MKTNFLFYPVSVKSSDNVCFDFLRHQFDTSEDDEIVETLSNVKDKIKIVRTDKNVEYEADLFNDWDDYVEDWLIQELQEVTKEHNLDEKFIKASWCIAVNDNVADQLELTD